MKNFLRSAFLLAASLALAACWHESSSPPAPAVPPPPPLPQSERERLAPQVHVDPNEAAALISSYRQSHGLSAVAPDPTVQKIAEIQAHAMAQENLLSHDVIGTLKTRYDAAKLSRATAIENVSAGYFSLADALRGWQSSPPHNANLLKPGMHKIGIATAYAPGTKLLVFWALDMSN
jgi:uncharacterized protein YkwD